MRAAWHAVVAAHLVITVLGGTLTASVAQAQQAAPAPVAVPVPAPAPAPVPSPPADPEAEASALRELLHQIQTRRSELEAQHRALIEDWTHISAVDRPASAEQIAQWRDRNAKAERQRERVAALDALLSALTPRALRAILPPGDKTYEFLANDVGLRSTSLEVTLRDRPEDEGAHVLKPDTLVVQVAADATGAWSVVVAAGGSGYVPTSMLRSTD